MQDAKVKEDISYQRIREKLKKKITLLLEIFSRSTPKERRFLEALLDGLGFDCTSWPDFIGYLSIDRLICACVVDGGVVVMAENDDFWLKMLYFFQDNGHVRCINYWRIITIDMKDCYPPMTYGDGNLIFLSQDDYTTRGGVSGRTWHIHLSFPGDLNSNLKGHLDSRMILELSSATYGDDDKMKKPPSFTEADIAAVGLGSNEDYELIHKYLILPGVEDRSRWIMPNDSSGTYISTTAGVFFLARRLELQKNRTRNRIWWLRPPKQEQ